MIWKIIMHVYIIAILGNHLFDVSSEFLMSDWQSVE